MSLRHVLKWILSVALCHSGIVWLARRLGAARGTILIHHRVLTTWVGDGMTVSQAIFEGQVRFLARRYRVVSLDEMLRRLHGAEPLGRDAVAITFDDGYRDNYTLGWPVLRRHGCSATIFLAVGAVEGEVPLWTEQLRRAVWEAAADSLDGTGLGLGVLPIRSEDERLECLRALKRRLKAMPDEDRTRAVDRIVTALGLPPGRACADDQMLTWDMIRELRAGGILMGAHTVSHKILTRIGRQEARWEIEESKRRIEKALGEPVRHFAYPNGGRADWNADIQQLVREAGFATACTTLRGTNAVGADLLALRRLEINDPGCTDPFGRFSASMFAVQLTGLLRGWDA